MFIHILILPHDYVFLQVLSLMSQFFQFVWYLRLTSSSCNKGVFNNFPVIAHPFYYLCFYQDDFDSRHITPPIVYVRGRQQTTYIYIYIEWGPLIIIADSVINRLLLSKSVVPKHSI